MNLCTILFRFVSHFNCSQTEETEHEEIESQGSQFVYLNSIKFKRYPKIEINPNTYL